MVEKMANAYKALSIEDQELVYMLAVGRGSFKRWDTEFCKGSFGMCHDDVKDPWWSTWQSKQRDVLFFYRQKGGEWKFYCKYSMDNYSTEFQNTISELLAFADEPLVFQANNPPSMIPTNDESTSPTKSPKPSSAPTMLPTNHPSLPPTASSEPSGGPSVEPSNIPSGFPSTIPSGFPSGFPSKEPSMFPSTIPQLEQYVYPTRHPRQYPEKKKISIEDIGW
mmetsp:Transcript_23399/g.32788  ORF Transcript_23399/g.32788 Transcript_23399/m.32788 type:complete len:222 (+) Transcript_23399:302-967(+)